MNRVIKFRWGYLVRCCACMDYTEMIHHDIIDRSRIIRLKKSYLKGKIFLI